LNQRALQVVTDTVSGKRPSRIHFAAVVFDTPQAFAAERTVPPGMSSSAGVTVGDRARLDRRHLEGRCDDKRDNEDVQQSGDVAPRDARSR